MLPIGPVPLEITEEQLQQDVPRVRALHIQRLELVWARIEKRIQDDIDGTRPIDPRYLEIGLRALKDEAQHYRMFRPPAPVEEEEEDPSITAVDRGALVLTYLESVEARIKQGQAAAAAWGAGRAKEQDQGSDQDLNQHLDLNLDQNLGQNEAA